MSDLLVTSHTPILRTGRALRTYSVARALAATGGGLDLLYTRFEGDTPDAAFKAIPGVALHEVVSSRGARRLLAYAASRRTGVPAAIARGVSPELAARAAALAATPARGRVIADGPTAAATLARLARRRAVVYNAHNFESGFRHELGDTTRSGTPRAVDRALQRFERELLAHASETWMVSDADLAAARELCPEARLRLVPNALDVAAIAPVAQLPAAPRAAFVASFAYEPNRKGLRFLLDEVMPRVWAALPDAQLELVGGGLAQEDLGHADARVQPRGFVADLRAVYAGVRCVVVPLLHGGGTPLKLIEALAYGVPVVATPRAAAGLQVRDGEHCLIAEGPDAFAAALLRTLREDLSELARAGRALAAERYSIEALGRILASSSGASASS
jgi:glycosyltransferase involved in cell wall biosynthesis